MRCFSTVLSLAVCGGLGAASVASAATYPNNSYSPNVITNRALVTGVDSIDPAGSQELTTDNLVFGNITGKSDLTGLPGFAVLQNFSGFQPVKSSVDTNIVHYTDPNHADLKFTVIGDSTATGNNTGFDTGNGTIWSDSTPYNTSSTHSYALTGLNSATGTQTYQIEISFGKYNSANGAWDGTAANPTAAGFTITNINNKVKFDVTFYDGQGTAVNTSTFDGSKYGNAADALFGYKADPGEVISKILITKTMTGAYSSTQGLDDVGYTVVPEPGSLGLLSLVGLLLIRRRK